MSKTPNQKKKYEAHGKRVNKYIVLIERIYDKFNLEASKIAVDVNHKFGEPFSFKDYPETTQRIEDLKAGFASDIKSVVYSGTSKEWQESNIIQDLLANSILKKYNAYHDKDKYTVYYQNNSDVLKAFQNRKEKGLNLSTKLWEQSKIYKEELEAAISCGLEKGTSAVTLSKKISKYLKDFPSLQKDYKENFGEAKKLVDCEYRSIRLARTEINMAYRKAEQTRWNQMDFVVGYEIKRSGVKFSCPLCESLKGKYPKDFEFKGWHPSCRCYVVPIMKSEDEFWNFDGRDKETTDSVNEVKDVPDNYKKWISDNKSRIEEAKKNGTLPYFLKDNQEKYL